MTSHRWVNVCTVTCLAHYFRVNVIAMGNNVIISEDATEFD